MNLNPFDLRGPEFLGFYVVLLVFTSFVIAAWRQRREAGDPRQAADIARTVAQDPYQIAFLRGGQNEVLRVAVLSLLERGLLQAKANRLHAAAPDAAEKVRRPLDKAILTRFAGETSAAALYTDPVIGAEAVMIGAELEKQGLLPDPAARSARAWLIGGGTALLWVVAGIKLWVALARGRSNIGFLILLALATPFVLTLVSRRFRTALGDEIQAHFRNLFSGLKSRRESLRLAQTTSELTYLAAVFGLGALPGAVAGVIHPLRLQPPKPVSTGGGGSSCSTGSSCGGSSCGGGCGGGGCGGCGS